jgi:hypothetical protein
MKKHKNAGRRSSAGKSAGSKGDAKIESMIGAAIDAIVELGHAAEDIKSSLVHAQKAQRSAKPLTDQVKRVTQKATKAIRGSVSRKK